MADPFVAEIRIYPFNFAPKGWAFCNGQILPIPQNAALFSLLGTIYGGDGRFTFALPNMAGNAPMHLGQGPGLSPHFPGETGGSQTVTLLESQIPSHSHSLNAVGGFPGGNNDPANQVPAKGDSGLQPYTPSGPSSMMAPQAIAPAGGGQPHNNMQPYLTLNFCIALRGVYPPRT